MTIQPSFITADGQKWSGTHFIVGGGLKTEKMSDYWLKQLSCKMFLIY